MGSDRRKYVMTPELAMQREMAYRERLKLSHPKQKYEPEDDPSSQNPKQTPLPTLGFDLSPSLKNPTSRRTLNPFINVGPKVTNPSTSNPFQYRCPITKPNFSPGLNPNKRRQIQGSNLYRPHGQGLFPRPKASVVGPIANPNQQSTEPISGSIFKTKEPPKKSKLFCKMCGVICSSPSNLEMHLKGQKHLAKVNGKSEKVNVRIHCELCEIWCMDEFSYKQHLGGKSHLLKLHVKERNERLKSNQV